MTKQKVFFIIFTVFALLVLFLRVVMMELDSVKIQLRTKKEAKKSIINSFRWFLSIGIIMVIVIILAY